MSHLFAGRRWVLETALTQEECVSRLKSKLRGMWETKWDPDRPLYGTLSRSRFAVQISPGYGRGVNPVFIRGVFTTSAAGTTIRAKYGVLTIYRVFVTGMVSFFLFMGWLVIRHGSGSLPPGLDFFFGITLLFIVLSTYWGVGRMIRWAEFDRQLILDAVAEILEARFSETPEAVS
jgi:hypothetical protein